MNISYSAFETGFNPKTEPTTKVINVENNEHQEIMRQRVPNPERKKFKRIIDGKVVYTDMPQRTYPRYRAWCNGRIIDTYSPPHINDPKITHLRIADEYWNGGTTRVNGVTYAMASQLKNPSYDHLEVAEQGWSGYTVLDETTGITYKII
jgi:hypothetical protein